MLHFLVLKRWKAKKKKKEVLQNKRKFHPHNPAACCKEAQKHADVTDSWMDVNRAVSRFSGAGWSCAPGEGEGSRGAANPRCHRRPPSANKNLGTQQPEPPTTTEPPRNARLPRRLGGLRTSVLRGQGKEGERGHWKQFVGKWSEAVG